MKHRNRDDAAGSDPPSELPQLQSIEMAAHRDTTPVLGRFPVVLSFGGLSSPINVILVEYLDLRRAQGAQGNEPLDLSAVESLRYADRTLITVGSMHHSDFISFAMDAPKDAIHKTAYPMVTARWEIQTTLGKQWSERLPSRRVIHLSARRQEPPSCLKRRPSFSLK